MSLRSDSVIIIDKRAVPLPVRLEVKAGDVLGLGLDVYRECILVGHNGVIHSVPADVNYARLMAMHPAVAFAEHGEQVEFIFEGFRADIKQYFLESVDQMLTLPTATEHDLP
jgi:hypothetical protein